MLAAVTDPHWECRVNKMLPPRGDINKVLEATHHVIHLFPASLTGTSPERECCFTGSSESAKVTNKTVTIPLWPQGVGPASSEPLLLMSEENICSYQSPFLTLQIGSRIYSAGELRLFLCFRLFSWWVFLQDSGGPVDQEPRYQLWLAVSKIVVVYYSWLLYTQSSTTALLVAL